MILSCIQKVNPSASKFGDLDTKESIGLSGELYRLGLIPWKPITYFGSAAHNPEKVSLSNAVQGMNRIKSEITPKVSKYKSKIILWILYWPSYLVIYLFSDVVRDTLNFVYRKVSGYFQSVSDDSFNKLM